MLREREKPSTPISFHSKEKFGTPNPRTPNIGFLSTEDIIVGRNPPQWSVLDCSHSLIKNVSIQLYDFKFLTSLYLNNNFITQLPQGIYQLTNLLILDLSHNLLRMLPKDIGRLVNLKELHVNDNRLETLPFEMGTMIQLHT